MNSTVPMWSDSSANGRPCGAIHTSGYRLISNTPEFRASQTRWSERLGATGPELRPERREYLASRLPHCRALYVAAMRRAPRD